MDDGNNFSRIIVLKIVTEALQELIQLQRGVNRTTSTNFSGFHRRPYFCLSTY